MSGLHTRVTRLHALLRCSRLFFVFSIIPSDIYFWVGGTIELSPLLSSPRLKGGGVGRDDFNFLSWIVSASSYIVSVTERNSLDSMVLVRVVPHTQHKRYPCDRNFSKE